MLIVLERPETVYFSDDKVPFVQPADILIVGDGCAAVMPP